MDFQTAKPYIDERIKDVKIDETLTSDQAWSILVKLVELFDFPEIEKNKAMEYIKKEMDHE